MTRDLTLHIDEFGQQALARFTRGGGGSMARAVRVASIYYLNDRDAGRAGWKVPRFTTDSHLSGRFQVELDDETWAGLRREADRAGRHPRRCSLCMR